MEQVKIIYRRIHIILNMLIPVCIFLGCFIVIYTAATVISKTGEYELLIVDSVFFTLLLFATIILSEYNKSLKYIVEDRTVFCILDKSAAKMTFDEFYAIYNLNSNNWQINKTPYYYLIETKTYLPRLIFEKRLYIYFNIFDYFRYKNFTNVYFKKQKEKERKNKIAEELEQSTEIISKLKENIDKNYTEASETINKSLEMMDDAKNKKY